MEYCQQHTFLVLTKRPERISPVLYGQEGNFYLGGGDYMTNVWLGTTIENQEMADKRIPELLKCEPFKLFLSIEPILSKINLKLCDEFPDKDGCYEDVRHQINWVIAGAESGHNRRECKIEWIENIVEQCKSAYVPVFVKQIHLNGKLIKDINQFPENLRIRELPWIK